MVLSRSNPPIRSKMVHAGAARMIAAATVAITLASACGGASSESKVESGLLGQAPVSHVDARETVRASALDELVQASDVVFVGVVRAVKRGRTVGEKPEAIQLRDLEVTIEEVWAGSAPGAVVHLEEEGLVGGRSYSINHSKWGSLGDRAIFFAVNKGGSEADFFRLTSTQGRFFIMQDGSLRGNYEDAADPLTVEVERLSISELEGRVRT